MLFPSNPGVVGKVFTKQTTSQINYRVMSPACQRYFLSSEKPTGSRVIAHQHGWHGSTLRHTKPRLLRYIWCIFCIVSWRWMNRRVHTHTHVDFSASFLIGNFCFNRSIHVPVYLYKHSFMICFQHQSCFFLTKTSVNRCLWFRNWCVSTMFLHQFPSRPPSALLILSLVGLWETTSPRGSSWVVGNLSSCRGDLNGNWRDPTFIVSEFYFLVGINSHFCKISTFKTP